MNTKNRFIYYIARYLLRKKIKKFSFTYEVEVYETDVVDQTYVRHYINELQDAVQKEVEHLSEEYGL